MFNQKSYLFLMAETGALRGEREPAGECVGRGGGQGKGGGCPPGPLVRMSGPGRRAVVIKKLVLDPGCRAAVN